MEYFGFFDPFSNGGRNQGHRKNHSSELLVKSKGELVNEDDIIGDSCLRSEILEVSDVLLESIVQDSIRVE